jgi:hypothetical protein
MKKDIIGGFISALADGKISKAELISLLLPFGLAVVDKGVPGQLQKLYEKTDINSGTMQELLSTISEVHILLGALVDTEGVK